MTRRTHYDESRGPGRAALVRCRNCFRQFDVGGTVSPERRAREYEREREERAGYASRTRRYNDEFHKYYGTGEAGFSRGGVATRRRREPESAQAKQQRVAKLIDQIRARNAARANARR